MTTASPTATTTGTPAPANAPSGGNPKPGLVSRLFFPVAFVLMLVWGFYLATGDKVPKENFDPVAEFSLDEPVIGGHMVVGEIFGLEVDLAINKGVIYLLLALLGSVLFAVYVQRKVVRRMRQETRPHTLVESVYEFAHDEIAGMLGRKMFSRYMPFVASLFIFIWFLNVTSFLPLPLNTHHTVGGLDYFYSFGLYAVTSNIFCTVTLAIATFFIYHAEGVRAKGFFGYLKSWNAGQGGPAGAFVWVVEALTNLVLKPVSLAVRLFANMLSGHVLILLMLALAGIIGGSVIVTAIAQVAGTGVALAFFLFELGLVATLQAFIFAVLSAIYIGSATEEHH